MENKLLKYILEKKHYQYRKDYNCDLASEYKKRGLDPEKRMLDRFIRLTEAETPVILTDERICFLRTVKNIPDCFTEDEWNEIKKDHFIHELGYMSNLCPNYEKAISKGLLFLKSSANEYGKKTIDAILSLCDRYLDEAIAKGREDIAKTLRNAPRYGAKSFREALQLFRILHFSLWLEGNYHVTVGRFDQYMLPYLENDIKNGVLDEEEALSLLRDFFISFNKDSDLYPGVQQGDNGQSMVLGGCDESGNDCFNRLSRLCLIASRDLRLIDPKINLRVGKYTPDSVYKLGTELTRVGLGFPQYSNDDIVIPALEKLGYSHRDASNYVVAACWEFIIPNVGADIANIAALSFPKVIDTCLHKYLTNCESFDAFIERTSAEIKNSCEEICGKINNTWFAPSHFMSCLMDTPKYNNYGMHGTGIATAADSLSAIEKYVFNEKTVTAEELVASVDSNFERGDLLHKLRYEAPKTGQDERANELMCYLLSAFSNALEGRKNDLGGVWRAGTGSAMFYLRHAEEIGASPDGRLEGEAFGTNFSPSLFARLPGPLSVISAFTKPDFSRAINGGPLTLEFHSGMFSDEESTKKVADLVKTFILLGGHQLQLNSVDPQKLLDAQKHPEKYRRLVVRIWGWSAYFVELDKEFQDHVIARQIHKV